MIVPGLILLIVAGAVIISLLVFLSSAPEEQLNALYYQVREKSPDKNITWEEFIDACERIYKSLVVALVVVFILFYLILL